MRFHESFVDYKKVGRYEPRPEDVDYRKVCMLIVAFLNPQERIKMKSVHRSFWKRHVPNAWRYYDITREITVDGHDVMVDSEDGELDLSHRKLKTLKGIERAAPFIKALNLRVNELETLDRVSCCVKVTEIDLSFNKVAQIENQSVKMLPNLERIYGQGNLFTAIPYMELPKLRNLSLNSNQITAIEHISHLHSLDTLILRNNNITQISGLEGLKKLRWLDISENQLTQVSGLSDQSTSLEKLFLTGNQLGDFKVVEYLGKTLKKLKFVFLDKNPFFEREKDSAKLFKRVKKYIKNVVRIE